MVFEELKRQAAIEAVKLVKPGMIIGLGTGSTAKYAIEEIGRLLRIRALSDVAGVPSSKMTEILAIQNSVPLTSFNEIKVIDLNIDGADEVDTKLNLIKGGGGALLKEKIIAQASIQNIIIVDESKLSPKLGFKWSVPVEVIPFALELEKSTFEGWGAKVKIRVDKNGKKFTTDSGNNILDVNLGKIEDPFEIESRFQKRAGVVESGIFAGLTTDLIVATTKGLFHLNKGDSDSKFHLIFKD
ncbi:MAG: ribose-5-phosphate isomerase RpiA [Ignavibacteriaceae bacterium]|nr:ribose-5-phosphate isomerase RpiA [Ignavibacteriaceae bacterium]